METKRLISPYPYAPAMMAREIVDRIMKDNQEEKGDSWLSIPIDEHVHHGVVHLVDFYDKQNENGEDHLAHALTRIAMAITLRERSRDDQPS